MSNTNGNQPSETPLWNNMLSDPMKMAKELFSDYAGVRSQASLMEIAGLLKELIMDQGQPLDDRKGTTELLIGILTALPNTSEARTRLTHKLIDTLWDTLQHPPLSYVGGDVKFDIVNPQNLDAKAEEPDWDTIEFKVPGSDITLREHVPDAPRGMLQYRMPDGSHNNILEPDLGKAGTSYARTVKSTKSLHGVKPDPGLLFDTLMARDEEDFKENPAGISSMFFYHAAIIIHDIFRTNRRDMSKSDTSSYLDLAPLYGSSLKDQLEIRTMTGGKLHPDTFHEKRLLRLPAGVGAMLVMYSRFHNHVCDVLLQINENGRFALACGPDASAEDRARAHAKQDHDLFNTARLVVGGLYVNVSLHDYLRAITNTHQTRSDWTLDPRGELDKQFDGEGSPRGVGNQVSVEFNLLYRFHSCISKKDEQWINNFFLKLFPGRNPDELANVGMHELGLALQEFESRVPKDPSKREFAGLKRQEDGTFRDEDLVRVFKEAMDDPAGAFGSRTIPKALKIVEVLAINQARGWQVASLNEFRKFFGLKTYGKFTEINPNPDIAGLLENLYTDPDMVELYPGLMIEDIKPVRNPGCGIAPPYSLGRAILSDAITLVRSDRFNTLDFNVSNLTAWGYNEAKHDPKTLGGSMLYKLIQRGLPGWFPFNSVAVMQPFYTKKANAEIAKRLGTFDQYTLDDPSRPPTPIVVSSNAAIKKALGDPRKFAVPWLRALNALFPGKKDMSWFMFAGDEPENAQHRASLIQALRGIPELHKAVREFIHREGRKLIDAAAFDMKKGLSQVDLIRDMAMPLNARLLADMFYFDMCSDENPDGKLSAEELYGNLLDIRVWGVNDNDPAQSWTRRRRAQEGAQVVIDTTRKLVDEVTAGRGMGLGVVSALSSVLGRRMYLKQGSLRSCGHKLVETLLDQGLSPERVVDTLWLTAFGGVGVPVTSFYEIMNFFLREENTAIWDQVQGLAQKNDQPGIHAYVVEAQRLTSTQRNVRIATQKTELEGTEIHRGDVVVMLLGDAGRNPAEVQDANTFDASRKTDAVTAFSYGQHECLAKDLALAYITGLVKLSADLKNLRPAPGEMGVVKTISVGPEKAYLNDSWSDLTFDANTWKVHFDGHGKGAFMGQREAAQVDMQRYYYLLEKRHHQVPRTPTPPRVVSLIT